MDGRTDGSRRTNLADGTQLNGEAEEVRLKLGDSNCSPIKRQIGRQPANNDNNNHHNEQPGDDDDDDD